MILYIIKSTLCLASVLGLYYLVLERSRSFQFNRYYLLGGLILSLAIPLVEIDLKSPIAPFEVAVESTITELVDVAPIQVSTSMAMDSFSSAELEPTSNRFSIGWILAITYLLGLMFFLIRFIINLFRFRNFRKIGRKVDYQGTPVYLVERKIPPHSFFKTVYLNQMDFNLKAESNPVLSHELGHTKQLHSIDVVFIELVKAVFWFNVVFVLIGKAIRTNHEYLADEYAIQRHPNIASYQNHVLEYLSRSSGLKLASFFNFRLAKKRFQFMGKKPSKFSLIKSVVFSLILFSGSIIFFGMAPSGQVEIGIEEVEPIQQLLELPVRQSALIPEGWPIEESNIKRPPTGFGKRVNPVNNQRKFHRGVDFSAEHGTPVFATADGKVQLVKSDEAGYGRHIIIDHGGEYKTQYAHLSEFRVSINDVVKKGDVIGSVGSTGKSTAPHLHYEVIRNNKKVDPQDYLPTAYQLTLDDGSKVLVQLFKRPGATTTRNPWVAKEYGLTRDHRQVIFPDDEVFKYNKIVFDDSLIVLFKETLVIQKKVSELKASQYEALIKLTSQPGVPPVAVAPLPEIVANWTDPATYGIWIDGLRVDNSVMANYTSKDFKYHYKSILKKNAKNYGKHLYQLDLYTPEAFEKAFGITTYPFRKAEWEKETLELLKEMNF